MTNTTKAEAPLLAAVQEARAFLDAHRNLYDDREVRVISPVYNEDHQLSLGTVRALYDLAASVTGIIAEYGDVLPAAASRAAASLPSITCSRCGMTSYSPGDIEHGYCGNCHDWTTDTGSPANK
jgi:hypothetical protein